MPLADQVAALERHARALLTGLRAGHQKLKGEIDALAHGTESLTAVRQAMERDAAAAGEQFSRAIDELAGFGRLVEAARQFKHAVEARAAQAAKELGGGHGKVEALGARLANETSRLDGVERDVAQRIEELARHADRLPVGHAHAPAVPSPAPGAQHAVPASPVGADSPLTPERLRDALKQAYDHLCLFHEFQNRLVELPRLYHETNKRVPSLTPQRFHAELEALKGEWKVELHVLNEVATARERELAIWKNDRLYYYAFWK